MHIPFLDGHILCAEDIRDIQLFLSTWPMVNVYVNQAIMWIKRVVIQRFVPAKKEHDCSCHGK